MFSVIVKKDKFGIFDIFVTQKLTHYAFLKHIISKDLWIKPKGITYIWHNLNLRLLVK